MLVKGLKMHAQIYIQLQATLYILTAGLARTYEKREDITIRLDA